MTYLPFPVPDEAVDAAVAVIPAFGSDRDDVRAALEVAMPYLRFAPGGDNHHNAAACPYCTPEQRRDELPLPREVVQAMIDAARPYTNDAVKIDRALDVLRRHSGAEEALLEQSPDAGQTNEERR